ncbi:MULTISPECIES: CesT family type III secretion system chaperone [Vibrio]|uniref:Uncharacterized protein n=1 Tax=Vibrio bivalvicida TaxID=1276888 RepID=A0A177XUP5_9VIBR|nr:MULTISPECIES: CesT family type III secretion system chaperone [Vibrio]KLN64713.1 hypothetical protein ZX61_12715 [Vibrio sp. VPAP30]OAJ92086.1 hypothetical protein APB76_22270 [Vibrio bivalvicida]
MNERFKMVIDDLGRLLETELTIEGGLSSLTFENQNVVHLAPISEDQLVIFMSAGTLTSEQQAVLLLRQNFFSSEFFQPRIGLSQNNDLVIWSQYRINELDAPAINQILENLLDFAQVLSSEEPISTDLPPLYSSLMV